MRRWLFARWRTGCSARLWYAVLFSKPWMALEGSPAAQSANMNPILPYIITFVLNLLIAFVLAQICAWRNANTAARGSAVGILLWIGIVGPITFTTEHVREAADGTFRDQ